MDQLVLFSRYWQKLIVIVAAVSEHRSFQQQQSSTSFQQTSSVRQQEVFEATERDGAMRGYQPKGVDETGRRSAMARDSGLFGGIGGDDNSLVDNEFDYKKHSVKDLAQHFALVKPKAQLPNQILPEQKMFNGEQGPALNYLGGKQDFASQQQIFTKKEVSNEDIEASKKAYEMKKKQQMEQRQQQQQSSSSSSSMSSSQTSSSVVMREKKTEEVKTEQSERRRASISSALLMDPAAAHAEAGLIDPSAILRGEQLTRWALPPAKTPDAPSAPTHSSTLYRPKQSAGFRPFSGSASGPSPTPFSQPPATQSQPQPQPPPPQCPVIVETFEGSPPPKRQATSPAGPSAPSVMCPPSPPLYQATVKSSATVHPITNTDTALQTTNNQHTLTNHSLGERHLADTMLSLVPELPRSTESSPAGRTSVPSVETTTSSLAPPRNVAPSPTPSRRTPILVTTRPSSVSLDQRTRHVSKDDLARMMAELNAPLPPMVEIPDEIRASPLIFHGGLAAVSQQNPHHLNTQTITNGQTSQSSSNSTAICNHLHQ